MNTPSHHPVTAFQNDSRSRSSRPARRDTWWEAFSRRGLEQTSRFLRPAGTEEAAGTRGTGDRP